MAAALSGVTISFGPVPNFSLKTVQEADDILYNQLIPACEAKGVMLASFGNHAGIGNLLCSVERYQGEKAEHKLFNVEKIQQAFSFLPKIIQATDDYESGSCKLKYALKVCGQEDIDYGEVIAAMLLRGFEARFGRETQIMEVNCQFRVKVLVDIQ